MKVLAALFVAATLLFLAAVNLSFVDTSFVCAGAVLSGDGWHPATAALTLRQYRGWAGLWSRSAGHAWIRLPGHPDNSFANVDERDDQLRIAGCGTELRGVFSTSSGELIVHAREGDFRGNCLKGHLKPDCVATCVRGPEDL